MKLSRSAFPNPNPNLPLTRTRCGCGPWALAPCCGLRCPWDLGRALGYNPNPINPSPINPNPINPNPINPNPNPKRNQTRPPVEIPGHGRLQRIKFDELSPPPLENPWVDGIAVPRPHLPSGVANAVEVQQASVCRTVGRREAGDRVVTFFELADPAPDEVEVTLTRTRTLS